MRLYDKRDEFDFPIVNFPYLNSNILESSAYAVLVSQLIRYARVCLKYEDILFRGYILVIEAGIFFTELSDYFSEPKNRGLSTS